MSLPDELNEISRRTGISYCTLVYRYRTLKLRGEALESAVGSIPRGRGKKTITVTRSISSTDMNHALLKWGR